MLQKILFEVILIMIFRCEYFGDFPHIERFFFTVQSIIIQCIFLFVTIYKKKQFVKSEYYFNRSNDSYPKITAYLLDAQVPTFG